MPKDKDRVKFEIASAVILAALVAVSGWLLWNGEENKGEQAVEPAAVTENPPEKATDGGERVVEGSVLPETTEEAIPIMQGTESEVKIRLTVKGREGSDSWEIPINDSLTLAELMQKAAAEKILEMEFDDYGGSMGILITSLNGFTNGDVPNHYWFFYVNGLRADVGASSYQVKAGDEVEWRFEEDQGM